MPRRTIKFVQGGYYHIYNRGAGRRSIFLKPENYRFVLQLINRYLEPLQLTMIAYCLLPNHYHWLVRQNGEAKAGLLAQRVFNAYSKAFNNSNGRSGTLFEDRYSAIVVSSDEYLHHLCRYIHANPVRHGIATAPELWPYSNYLEWIGQRPGKLVDQAFVQAHFPHPGQYQAYVSSYLTGQVKLPAGLAAYLEELEND